MTAVSSKNASQGPHLPVIATLADTGPITQIKNAEKEPRNAIIELNSGTRMETATESEVNKARSNVTNVRLRR
jgi:hypothetical protein